MPRGGDEMGDLRQVELLQRRVDAGKPSGSVPDMDVYSAHPWVILGDRKEVLCFSPLIFHKATDGRPTGWPNRSVLLSAGQVWWWKQDKGKMAILGVDKESAVAYKRKLYYMSKITTSSSEQRLGYSMVEIELNQLQVLAAEKLVLCKVKSTRKNPGIAMPASSPCPKQLVSMCTAPKLAHPLPRPMVQIGPGSVSMPAAAVAEEAWERGAATASMTAAALDKGKTVVVLDQEAMEGGAATAGYPGPAVLKFGCSSVASAERMKEVAQRIPDMEGTRVVVVFSAMGKTSSNLLLAGAKALSCDVPMVSEIDEVKVIKELHLTTIDELGLDSSTVTDTLNGMEQLLMGVAMRKELILNTRDYLVSIGERLSTGIFSAYLNKLGRKYDALDVGLMATAKFTDILEATYYAIPIVPYSLWEEWESSATNTCGMGGSDLTRTTIGTEMGLTEIQWMQLALEGDMPVTFQKLCNPNANFQRVLTSIESRSNIAVLNIESTMMLNQSNFLAMSFSTFRNLSISFNCVALSEGNISLIVVPSKLSSHEFFCQELDQAVKELRNFAIVYRQQDRSIISLVGKNTQMAAIIFAKAVNVLQTINVEVLKFSHGSSEVMEVSLVVHNNVAEQCVQFLRSAFLVSEAQGADWELELDGCPVQMPEKSPAAAAGSSGDKRKADDDHPEAPPVVRQERAATDRSSVVEGIIETVRLVPEVQPEQPSGVEDDYPIGVFHNDYGIQFGDFNDVVAQVQPELIGYGMNSDNNNYLTTSEDSATKNPVYADHRMLFGGHNGGAPPATGLPAAVVLAASRLEDHGPMFNDGDGSFLDGTIMDEPQVRGDNSGYPAGSAARIFEEAYPIFDDDGNNYLDGMDMEEPLSPFPFGYGHA